MFFDSIIKTSRYNELTTAYEKLTQKYQNLHSQKQSEIEVQDQKIEQLSKKVRQWVRKYHQLEASSNEYSTELPETVDQNYVQKLQDAVAELSKTNHRLEQQLRAENQLIIQSKVEKPASDQKQKSVTKKERATMKIKDNKKVDKNNVLNEQENNGASTEDHDVELTFSPQFQALLEKHAQASRA